MPSGDRGDQVAILTGGDGRERAGSLASARDVADVMRRLGRRYQVIDILELHEFRPGHYCAAFLAIHGEGGEDGTLQGYLSKAGLPYTGSRVDASAVCMDKRLSCWIARSLHLKTPAFVSFRPGDPRGPLEAFISEHETCIIKPAYGGGSLGVITIDDFRELETYLANTDHERPQPFLLCKRVSGIEVSCAVIKTGEGIKVLPLLETQFDGSIYTYEIKHTPSARRHFCPARISTHLSDTVGTQSRRFYEALGMVGYARFDFIIDELNATAWFLEANTLPGFSRQGNLAQMAAGAGLSYDDMIETELRSCFVERDHLVLPSDNAQGERMVRGQQRGSTLMGSRLH